MFIRWKVQDFEWSLLVLEPSDFTFYLLLVLFGLQKFTSHRLAPLNIKITLDADGRNTRYCVVSTATKRLIILGITISGNTYKK